jgi:hypothetical protein
LRVFCRARRRASRYNQTIWGNFSSFRCCAKVAPSLSGEYGWDVVGFAHSKISRQWLGGARVGQPSRAGSRCLDFIFAIPPSRSTCRGGFVFCTHVKAG